MPGRRFRHSGGRQLHGHARARPDLPDPHPGALRRARAPAHGAHNQTPYETAFTVSIEAREGIDTGISAARPGPDHPRGHRSDVGPRDIIQPGHVFPLRARPGGVLERTGQTEGSVDLARLAGCDPAGVICEIMNEDGTMARVPDLQRFCAKHGLKMCSVSDLIAYRRRTEKLIERQAAVLMPTRLRRVHGHRLPQPRSTTSTTWPWSRATWTGPRTCSSASTPSA